MVLTLTKLQMPSTGCRSQALLGVAWLRAAAPLVAGPRRPARKSRPGRLGRKDPTLYVPLYTVGALKMLVQLLLSP